jgi:hypothetical protein
MIEKIFSALSLLSYHAVIGSFVARRCCMDCPKCKGLMVKERFSDYVLVCDAWKCLNCGAVVDPTITANQRKQPPASVSESVAD